MKSKFSVSEVCSTSWQRFKAQMWVLVGLFIGMTIIYSLLSMCSLSAGGSFAGSLVSNLICILFSCVFSLGYMKNIFQTLDGDEPQFSAFTQQARKIVTYFVANLLLGIIVGVGIIFLIIPGIYLMLRLQFSTAFIVEENAGITESLKRSWKITRGEVMPLFLLALAMTGFAILGLIVFGVGIFVAVPFMYMMYGCVFRKLNTSQPGIEE